MIGGQGWRARRPWLRPLAVGAGLAVAATALSACQNNEADYNLVKGAVARTESVAKQFVWVHQTLTTNESVSGQYEDPYRYDVLYSRGGQAAWEEVVSDDAVADRFLDPTAVEAFFSASPVPGAKPSAPGAPSPGLIASAGPQATTVAALLARHWVVDATGAPAVQSIGNEVASERTDPFYASMVFLQDISALITRAPNPQVRRWRPNDVQPVYKPTDDPFPPPPHGVTRYDVYQQPLPVLTSNSPGGTPQPPNLSNLVKVAIYVHNGLVVQIRMDVDPVDQLQALVNNYHLRLPPHLSRRGQELFAQQALTQLGKGAAGPPIEIGQTVWVGLDLGQGQSISLPKGAVASNLSILPGRGTRTSSH